MTNEKLPPFRRIVTANNDEGRSGILSDAPTPHIVQSGPGRGLEGRKQWKRGKEASGRANGHYRLA